MRLAAILLGAYAVLTIVHGIWPQVIWIVAALFATFWISLTAWDKYAAKKKIERRTPAEKAYFEAEMKKLGGQSGNS